MNQEDFNRCLDSIPRLKIRKWLDDDIRMLFKILYWCALRPSEALGLSTNDFNFTNRMVDLGETKGKKNQSALIPQRFCTELEDYIAGKTMGLIFISTNGKDIIPYRTFYNWCKQLGKDLHIEAWTTPQSVTGEKTVGHIMRKSIGKDMVYGEIKDSNGQAFKIPTISKHLRHAKPSMTEDKYLKASLSQVAEIF